MQSAKFSVRSVLFLTLLLIGSIPGFAIGQHTSPSGIPDKHTTCCIASAETQTDNSIPDLPEGPAQEQNQKEENKEESKNETDELAFQHALLSLLSDAVQGRLSSARFHINSIQAQPVPLYRLFHCWKHFV